MIRRIIDVGKMYDVVAYGTEALGVMRIEKGHAAGNELNGTTTVPNLGMGRMVSKKKDCIGSILSERESLNQPVAYALVGLRPKNSADKVTAGAHLMTKGTPIDAKHDRGYVTSAAFSPILNSSIGLGLLKGGATRMGEVLSLVSSLTVPNIDVEVVSAHFINPEGERLRA